jgi:hypothetical protein
MSHQTARNLAKQTADRLIQASRVPTTTKYYGTSEWTLVYDGALHIVITHVGEGVVVRLSRIPRKCSPNHILAATQDVDAALLWATKKVFGITITQ